MLLTHVYIVCLMQLNDMSCRDPNSHATLEAFQQCVEWAIAGKFSDEDVNEARLSLFSKVRNVVMHTFTFSVHVGLDECALFPRHLM